MADRVRWAIVGVGIAGFARSRAIRHDPRSELVCVWRGRKAEETGAALAASFEDAVGRADVVAVCSPNAAHPEQVRASLEAGRHVVCEFPLAPDVATARGLFDLARTRDRILHVEHIELLSATAGVLRGNVRPPLVRHVDVGFQRQGPAEMPGSELAAANVARLHRLVDVAGPVAAIEQVWHGPGQLRATLRLESGAPAKLHFEQSPYFSRRTRVALYDGECHWEQDGRALFCDGVPQTLLESAPLFDLDHAAAMRRILGEEPGAYVDEASILHVLAIVAALAAGRTGPIAQS